MSTNKRLQIEPEVVDGYVADEAKSCNRDRRKEERKSFFVMKMGYTTQMPVDYWIISKPIDLNHV